MNSPCVRATHVKRFESLVKIDNVVWTPATDGVYTDGYFELAMERAIAMLSKHCVCNTEKLLARIAPIEFNKLGPDVLMQTNVQFILQGGVWVPMSLAIQQESDPSKLSELLGACEHDFKITVNTEIDFVTSVHGCVHPDGDNSVALDSATATLLHELLQGLGIYSLVDGNIGGGFEGAVSLYDTLLRHVSDDVMVFPSTYHVQSISGGDLSQYDLSVAGHVVFNPTNFVPGISLSHLAGNGVIGVNGSNVQCLLEIDTASIDILNAIGWECAYTDKISDAVCDIPSDCLCVLDQACMHCDDAHQIDQYVIRGLSFAISLCSLLLLAIIYNTYINFTTPSTVQTMTQRLPPINNF